MTARRVLSTALLIPVVLVSMAGRRPAAERYDFDPSHTQIGFVARHMLVTNVRGQFNKFSGHIMLDGQDVTRSSAEVTIEVTSVDTGNERRDNHLRSADFFEVEKFPSMTFKSRKVEKRGDQLIMTGDLTIRDVTKQVEIPFELTGPVAQRGRKRIGAEGTLKINRFDYGLKWNQAVETGGLVVGEDIRVELNISAVSAPPAAQ